MIQVQVVGSADNANALANTDLQSAPSDGILEVWIVATGADTVVSVSAGQDTPIRRQTVQQKTAALVNINDDAGIALAVEQGQQLVINVDITAASSWALIARFIEA